MRATPRELVALVLALGSALAVLALAAGAAIEIATPNAHLSQAASSVLATALGAMIGATAAYLGQRGSGGPNPERDIGFASSLPGTPPKPPPPEA